MGTGIGFKGIAGVAKQVAQGTAIGATDKIPLLSESIEVQPQLVDHDYLDGYASAKKQNGVLYAPTGSLETYIPYTVKNGTKFVSIDVLLGLLMGSNSGFVTATGVSHLRILPEDDLNVFGTIGIYKGISSSSACELLGTMINSGSISGNAGEAIKANFEVQGQELKKSSTVNTGTSLALLPTDLANLLLFSHLTFQLGDQVDALANGDKLGISSFTINVNNNLTSAEQATPDSTHTDATQPLQAIRNGFREITLDITVPRYIADTLWTAKNADTGYQAKFAFTDGTDEFTIYFPNLHIQTTESAMSGAGALQQTINFKALRYNSDCPMEFDNGTTVSDDSEMWIELKNDRTAVLW